MLAWQCRAKLSWPCFPVRIKLRSSVLVLISENFSVPVTKSRTEILFTEKLCLLYQHGLTKYIASTKCDDFQTLS